MTQSTSARRFEGSTYLERVRDWLSEKYAGRNLELVVAVTEDALEFLAAERGVLWPGVPVLFVDLSSGRPDAVDGLPRAGGMLLEDFFSESFQLVKKILPETRQVVLAYGGSEVEREKRPSRQGGAP